MCQQGLVFENISMPHLYGIDNLTDSIRRFFHIFVRGFLLEFRKWYPFHGKSSRADKTRILKQNMISIENECMDKKKVQWRALQSNLTDQGISPMNKLAWYISLSGPIIVKS